MSLYIERQKLIKKSQELYSWQWFCLNSDNLMVSRYHKDTKTITDKNTGELKKISIIPYLWASKRFQDDRQKVFKINLDIKEIQEKLNKLK